MNKQKVIIPESIQLHSPYQLEDCQRRLRDLKKRHIQFTPIDEQRVKFRIRVVKSEAVPFPMVAYELHGVLRRWGGTGTRIESYRLQRFSMRIDTWVTLFIVISLLSAFLLILPSLQIASNTIMAVIGLLVISIVLGGIPLFTWMQHVRALNIEHDIHSLHHAILNTLNIQQ